MKVNRKTRKEEPLWKVREFLDFIQEVSVAAWICSIDISANEQTIGFQGRHEDKLCVTLKKVGDGFM